jgi:DNA repair protein RecN (Recombination protein N)
VRPGAGRAVVEGVFDLGAGAGEGGHVADALAALDRLGVEPEEGRLVVKREVQAAGRSRAWVNGSPVTVGVLAEVGALLVDLHGQHETQSLLRSDAQRALLDAFAGAADEALAVSATFEARAALLAEREELEARHAGARRRADYLRHVAEEIGAAAPKPGELEALESEARRLGHAEELGRTAAVLADLVDGDDRAAGHALAQAARLLATLERIDPRGTAGWREMVETALVNAEELARAVREYAEAIDLDPARLAAVERRRDVLFRLDQKYGPGLDRVRAAGEEARRELELLDTAAADLDELAGRIADAERRFAAACRALSTRRRTAARRLGAAVTEHLAALGMEGGAVRVALAPLEEPGRHGAERVEFLCALNPGLPERPVAKAASGGELSRLMLALKLELARHDAIPTLVFDEVDQGIGGSVAGRVGEALARVAASHQVLVITHLPQIAALAARHLVVRKSAGGGTTAADVSVVEDRERVAELARMLGGTSAAARRHAEEMLGAQK